MPRVEVPVTQITRAGVVPAAEVNGDPANNHFMTNSDGRAFVLVRNSAATATRTLSIQFANTVDGQSVTARTVSVPVSSSKYVGPFDPTTYGATVNLDVDHADLKLSAYRA